MPKATKRPVHTQKAKTISELTLELTAVKAELESLRAQCMKMNQTLLRLCCPKEWFDEEVDDVEVRSNAVWEPSLREIIDTLR